jgi:predicted ABC-type ATPase
MDVNAKKLIVIGGPNGAGKTTFAEKYSVLHKSLYLAADKIAAELNPDNPESVNIDAASEFIAQLEAGLSKDNSLIVESTLSGKTFRHQIQHAKDRGFYVAIVFVFLDSADACVDRVSERRQKGGHNVPEADIRRRFGRSLVNFWEIYRPLSDHWLLANNSGRVPIDVAIGTTDTISVRDSARFRLFQQLLENLKHG